MNDRSSRSHCVFTVNVTCTLPDGAVANSKLNMVDLAGSERISKTGATGSLLKEAQKINLSLTTLGKIIMMLAADKGDFIPFRESKLTMVLKESLGGNSITTLLCAASSREANKEESMQTFEFANRAKAIKCEAKLNVRKSPAEMEKLIEKLKKEIEALKSGLGIDGDSAGEVIELRNKMEIMTELHAKEIDTLRTQLEMGGGVEEARKALSEADRKMDD